jgi:hypothetical protein
VAWASASRASPTETRPMVAMVRNAAEVIACKATQFLCRRWGSRVLNQICVTVLVDIRSSIAALMLTEAAQDVFKKPDSFPSLRKIILKRLIAFPVVPKL